MSCSLEIPSYPVGEPRPCVLRITIIGDGREILGEYAVEVPVATDRGNWHSVRANLSLLAVAGTVGLAVAIAERKAAESARLQVLETLAVMGHGAIAEQLARSPEGT